MKKVHADWEIRNFGVDCMEFHLEKGDTIEHLQEAEQSILDFDGLVTYIVPAGDCHIQTAFLEDRGYHFDHAVIECALDFPKNREYFKKFEFLIKGYRVRKITEKEDMERICNEIQKGIFNGSKERYASISGFNDEKYNQRLAWWLRDWFLIGKIVLMEVLNEDGEGIAFFSYIPKNEFTVESHLSGTYVNHKKENAGIWLILVSTQYHHAIGTKSSISYFSSNNLPILRLTGRFGMEVRAVKYYFSKIIIQGENI